MADITVPQVISWDNNRARTIADKMVVMLNQLLAWQTDYVAQGVAAAISGAGGSNKVGDGYATDGRQPVTGDQVGANFKAGIDQLVTAWNTTLVSGVGTTVATIQNIVQVNGSPR